MICDRDTKFTEQFRRCLSGAGVETIRTPRQAPNCNAYAERFVRSIKSECLSRMMLFGEAGLQHAVTSYVEHCNRERPHQGLGKERIALALRLATGPIQCNERLGGLLKHYRRAA